MDPSFPQFTSQSLGLPSQGSSGHIFSCKWAWCRSTFSDNAALVHHVIHDHARRSIPIRRRDIAMIRRAEEGSGDSLHVSSLVKGLYAPNSQKSTQNSRLQGMLFYETTSRQSHLITVCKSRLKFGASKSIFSSIPSKFKSVYRHLSLTG